MKKHLVLLLLLMAVSSPLFAQPVTITVSNTFGDSSAGSFGGAITAINATTGGGAVSFGISPGSIIYLSPPLPVATQNVTLTGNTVTFNDPTSLGIQILSTADFSLGPAVTLFVEKGVGGTGTDNSGNAGINGGNGSAVGDIAVTALSSTVDVNSFWLLSGGYGGAGGAGGLGANGGNGNDGGGLGVTVGSLTLNSGARFNGTAGLSGVGGAAGAGGIAGQSGTGGSALFSVGSLTTNTGSNFSFEGGQGNGGTFGGAGGAVIFNATAVTMNGGTFTLLGGQGGGGGGGSTPGNGGSVGVTISSLTMTNSGSFQATGGSPANGALPGNATASVTTMNLSSNSSFTLDGGGGNAGIAVQSLTMDSSSNFILNGTSPTASVSFLNGSGSINLGSGTLQVQNGGYSGSINGGNLIIPNSSTLFTLDGSAVLSGSTSVLGALTLGSNSTANAILQSSVTIAGSGNLEGFGTVHGTLTNSGVVTPGDISATIGSMTITQFNQTPGGFLALVLSPGNNQSNFLTVSGADLSGGLTLDYLGGNYGFRDRYSIISGGPVTGTFSSVGAVPGMTSNVIYGSSGVSLVLLQSFVDFTAFSKTPNELALSTALNASLLTCSDTLSVKEGELFNLPSGQTPLLDQLGGIIYTTLPNVLLDNLQFEDDLLFNRLGNGVGGSPNSTRASLVGDIISSEVTGDAGHAAGLGSVSARGLWLQNTDGFGSVNATDNVTGFNKSNVGFLGGYDTNLSPSLTAGVMGGYLQSTVTSTDSTATAGVNGIQFGLYGNVQLGDLDVSALGGYVADHFTVTRNITLGSDMNQLAGAYDGSQIAGALQLDYRLVDVDTTIKPFAGLQYAHLSENAFTETGSDSLNLSIPAQSYDSLRPYLGLGETWSFALGKGVQLIPGARVSVSQELMNTFSEITTALGGATGNPFTVGGIAPALTEFAVGGGVELQFGKQFDLFANYNGHFSGTQNLNTFNGGVNLAL